MTHGETFELTREPGGRSLYDSAVLTVKCRIINDLLHSLVPVKQHRHTTAIQWGILEKFS